jgi:hypothetical protein
VGEEGNVPWQVSIALLFPFDVLLDEIDQV